MPKLPLTCLALAMAAWSLSAFADTVTLTSGEKLEGKITSETDTEITIDVKVSANITDPQTVKKSDVLSVSKEAADEVAWQSVKNIKLGASSLPVASYEMFANSLRNFATNFPQSSHAAEAQKTADALLAEKKRVDAGEVKLDNKWLSKEEAQKERYQINALLAFNFMREQSTRDLVGALNTFDAIERNYAGSRIYPEAVELAKRLLQALKTEVDRRGPLAVAAAADRAKGVQLASEPQKTELSGIHKRDEAAADAMAAAAEKQGLKWAPLLNYNQHLQRTGSKIPSEMSRLNSIPVAKMRESIKLAEAAQQALAKADITAAEESARQATEAWSENELARRITTDLAAAKASGLTPSETPEASLPVPETPPAETGTDTAAATEEVSDEEEAKPFLLTPAGAIVLVIVIAFLIAAFNAYKKVRGRANEIIE